MTENILLLQNFVSSKCDRSEHSDSEFYYPGKLSDSELLQLPTYSVTNLLLTNEEVHKMVIL